LGYLYASATYKCIEIVFPRFAKVVLRASPWIIAAAAVVAFGATYSELRRWQSKFNYMDAWQYASRVAVNENSIVIMGDSITVNAPLPRRICGQPVVKVGFGGAGTYDFLVLSRGALEGTHPQMIIVALGANDRKAAHLADDYRALLEQVATYAPHVVAVSNTSDQGVLAIQREVTSSLGVPYQEIEVTGLMPDRVHFDTAGYRQWMPSIAGVICRQVAEAR
jgi:hypothetical protein